MMGYEDWYGDPGYAEQTDQEKVIDALQKFHKPAFTFKDLKIFEDLNAPPNVIYGVPQNFAWKDYDEPK